MPISEGKTAAHPALYERTGFPQAEYGPALDLQIGLHHHGIGDAAGDMHLRIVFDLPDAIAPKSLGYNLDVRHLSVRWDSVTLYDTGLQNQN